MIKEPDPPPSVTLVRPSAPEEPPLGLTVDAPAKPNGKGVSHRPIRRPPPEPRPKNVVLPQSSKDPPKPQGTGYLTVAAEPYAEVRIDGLQIGTTPIFRRPIPAGDHEITLVRPDTGEVRLKKQITIQPDLLEKVIVR
jgi:hypothetical protein